MLRAEVELLASALAEPNAWAAPVEPSYRWMAEAIPQLVFSARPDGHADFFNSRWYDYTGTTIEEAEGDGWTRLLHPDDRERAGAAWQQATTTGSIYEIQYRLRRASDGHHRWFLGRALPVRDEGGRIVRWFGTLTDIHEQKRGEELLSLQARAGAALAASLDYETTLRNVVEMLVPALADWAALDLIGDDGAVRRMRSCGGEALADRVDGGEGRSCLEIPLRARGRVLGAVSLGYADAGRCYGAADELVAKELAGRAALAIDNARLHRQLRSSVAALARSNRDLDQFAYVASHDLKAPLRGIGNLAQWIEEDLGEEAPAAVREHVRLLQGRTRRLEALVDGILRYSRAGKRSSVEEVDVAALVAEVVELHAPTAATVRIGEMPTLHTDRTQLAQVFGNLVANALEHASVQAPVVEITARRVDASWYEFTVADDGVGIDQAHHDRIWQIFQTLGGGDDVGGIGLAVVKKIVEARGGRVELESAPGAGATFRFLWPCREEPR